MSARKFLENKKFFPLLVTGITIAQLALVGCAGGGSPIPPDKALAVVPPVAAPKALKDGKITVDGISIGPEITRPPDIPNIYSLTDNVTPSYAFDTAAYGLSSDNAHRVAWFYRGDQAVALAEQLNLPPELAARGEFVIYYKPHDGTMVRYNTNEGIRAFDAKVRLSRQTLADGLQAAGVNNVEVFPWGSSFIKAWETPDGFAIFQQGNKWLVRQGGAKVSDLDFFLQSTKGGVVDFDKAQILGLMRYLEKNQPALLKDLVNDRIHLFSTRGKILEYVPNSTEIRIRDGANFYDVGYLGSFKVVARAFGTSVNTLSIALIFIQPLQTPLKFAWNEEQLPGLGLGARFARGADNFWSAFSPEDAVDLKTNFFNTEWPASRLPSYKTKDDQYLSLAIQSENGKLIDFPWFVMKKGEKPNTVLLKILKKDGAVFGASASRNNNPANEVVKDTITLNFGDTIILTYPPDANGRQIQHEVQLITSTSEIFAGQTVIHIKNLGEIAQNPNLPVTYTKAQTP